MKAQSDFLSQTMVNLLNYRIEQEEFSSRLYLSMSLWLTNEGYLGAGKLFKKFSDEELLHAEKAKDMLLANGLQPITPALEKPEQDFKSLPKVIEMAFDHEKVVTRQCYELTKSAFKEDNFMVAELGLWYAKEQAEELDKFQNFMDRLEAFGTDPDLLRELDNEMGNM